MPKQYRSGALAAVHEAALGLTEAGVMSKRTMKVFDEMCLTPIEDMAPERRSSQKSSPRTGVAK